MNERTNELPPEDYAEPRCVLCDEPYGAEPAVRAVPQQRIIEKMDDYMSRRDYSGAERHLLYWLEEARLGHDQRGELMVENELIGHYRKVSDRARAMDAIREALRLVDELGFDGTLSAGTTYTNAATACSAFGENERALALFEKARAIYEASPRTGQQLLGGLYNNMALACAALGRFREAYDLYDRAMEAMGRFPGGGLEQAITCLNRADALTAERGMEQSEHAVYALLDQAYALLTDPAVPHGGYYAFVCEKCAPSFAYYGYFAAADELTREAKRIYERT